MSGCVNWIVVSEVLPENRKAFEALAAEIVAAVEESEPGTLLYDWFWNATGDRCTVIERYVDSAAGMVHLGNLQARFFERAGALSNMLRVDFYGEPSDELHAVMRDLGAEFHTRIEGFGR